MSGFEGIDRLNGVYDRVCPEFEVNWFSGFLVALDYYPLALWLGTFSISIYSNDLFLALLGVWLTLDWWVNKGLRWAIRQPPPTPGCGARFEMPSFSAQEATMFITVLWLFMVLYGYRALPVRAFGLVFFAGIVMYARVYIGLASPAQLIVGALVGLASGLLFHALVYWLVRPRVGEILAWRVCRHMQLIRGVLGRALYADDDSDISQGTLEEHR